MFKEKSNTHLQLYFGNNDGMFSWTRRPDNLIIFPVISSAINGFIKNNFVVHENTKTLFCNF